MKDKISSNFDNPYYICNLRTMLIEEHVLYITITNVLFVIY